MKPNRNKKRGYTKQVKRSMLEVAKALYEAEVKWQEEGDQYEADAIKARKDMYYKLQSDMRLMNFYKIY